MSFEGSNVAPEDEFFARSFLLPYAREAYEYARGIGIYQRFFGEAEFNPDIIFYDTGERMKPLAQMEVEGSDGVIFSVGAEDVPDEGIRGYYQILQRYGRSSYVVLDIYLKDGRPDIVCLVIEGIDYLGKQRRVSLSYDRGSVEDRAEVVDLFMRFGVDRLVGEAISVEGFEKLACQMANGCLATKEEVRVDDVVVRVGDLLLKADERQWEN